MFCRKLHEIFDEGNRRVDNENRLVGIVSVDDAIIVLQDEAEEDFEKMAAMAPTEESYFETSVFKHAKNRIVWLLILMLSSAITRTNPLFFACSKSFTCSPFRPRTTGARI